MISRVLLIVALLTGGAFAQGPILPGPGLPVAAGGYVGPLDVSGLSTNVVACYSLRACSSATRGSPVVNACDSTGGTDVACADLSTNATTGQLVPATIGGGTCPGTLGTNCTIKIWYDQTASGACTGSCDLLPTAGLIVNRPTLPGSVLGSFGVARMTTSQSSGSNGNNTTAQPLTLSSVSRRTSGTGVNIMFGAANAPPSLLFDAATVIEMFAGSIVAAGTGAENAFHNISGVFNGASSKGWVDGVAGSTVNPGSTGFGSTINVNNGSFATNMESVENIVWSADKTSSMTALCTNQFSYWGTAVSC